MAEIRILKAGEPEGNKRPDDPLPRPYVKLNDGTVMSYSEWLAKGTPA